MIAILVGGPHNGKKFYDIYPVEFLEFPEQVECSILPDASDPYTVDSTVYHRYRKIIQCKNDAVFIHESLWEGFRS